MLSNSIVVEIFNYKKRTESRVCCIIKRKDDTGGKDFVKRKKEGQKPSFSAERGGFEPPNRFRRLHAFQS